MLVCLLLEQKIVEYILQTEWKKAVERGENEVLDRKQRQTPEPTGVEGVCGNPLRPLALPVPPTLLYLSFLCCFGYFLHNSCICYIYHLSSPPLHPQSLL